MAPSLRAGTDRSRTRTLRNAAGKRCLDLLGVEVELVGPHADQTHVEDQVGVPPGSELLDEGRLRGDARGIELDLLEARPADLALLDHDRLLVVPFIEGDEEDLAGPVLVQGDRLRGTRVGVDGRAGLARLCGVPVAEGEVVDARRGDLLRRDDDLVAVGLAGDRDASRGPSRCATWPASPSSRPGPGGASAALASCRTPGRGPRGRSAARAIDGRSGVRTVRRSEPTAPERAGRS